MFGLLKSISRIQDNLMKIVPIMLMSILIIIVVLTSKSNPLGKNFYEKHLKPRFRSFIVVFVLFALIGLVYYGTGAVAQKQLTQLNAMENALDAGSNLYNAFN